MRKKLIGEAQDKVRGYLHPAWVHIIESREEVELYLEAIALCYKQVFIGHPYQEVYLGQEEEVIKPSFRNFAERGVLVVLATGETLSDGRIIGFGACEGADVCEAKDFLRLHSDKLEVQLDRYVYMAEVGVLPEFCRQGFGKQLILMRIEAASMNLKHNFTHLIMRTASEGSNSVSLYQGLGATVVDGLVQEKNEYDSKSKRRIFLTRRIP